MNEHRRDTLLRLDHAAARQKILERRQAFQLELSLVVILAFALPTGLGVMGAVAMLVFGWW